ncbi:B12-binding domain-containing radical SAM protein [Streptomyces sp. NRRL S-118]|uniref:B12-binding domain-containing radical SAM protein n=1 Tax=Streptomyces sp. NRRL S-118 TaxID=1463881 RepID=UPI0004C9668A|nr:radical SAM protein [Streptomyces sp. NRRL S-118]
MIGLVFPPLVESNFGSFYPSTAVLAGFLQDRGLEVWQHDLNEDFAEFLLAPAELAPLAEGRVPGAARDSYTASAARWALREPELLVGPDGRHLFGAGRHTGRIVEALAVPFRIDPDEVTLRRGAVESAGDGIFGRFYERWAAGQDGPPVPDGTTLVGISVPMGPQLVPSLLLALRLKAVRPAVRVVLGGPALSLMLVPELERLLADFPEVDAVVRFDGEFPLLSLARQAEAGTWEPERVPGVSCLLADGTPHTKDPAPGPNLNSLPRPVFPAEAMARLSDPVLGVTQARGCYWGKCDYCDFVELYDGSPPFRGRHPDAFVDELEHLVKEHGTRRFSFVTESIPPAFARRMSKLLIERQLDITWSSFVMVDRRFDRELLGLMAASGCEFLVVGMETTITRVLKLVHKSADREENLRFLREAHAAGVKLVVNLIPDLPSTTYEEALQALADVEGLAHCMQSVSVFPFEATRSSRVGRDPEAFGLVVTAPQEGNWQSQYALNHLPNTDPAMTPEQRADIHRRYAAFADRVNGTADAAPREVRVAPDTALRIPVEDFDLYVPDEEGGTDGGGAPAGGSGPGGAVGRGSGSTGRLRAVNLRTKECITLPPAARARLTHLLDGRPFTPRELAAAHGERVADVLVSNLRRSGLLAEAGRD